MPYPALRRQIAHFTRLLYSQGYVVASEGNVSVRVAQDRFLITGSGVLKSEFKARDVVLIDSAGNLIWGKRKPTTERFSHLAIYSERPDVSCIVHAHPVFTVLASVLKTDCFSAPVLSEAAMFLKNVRVAPYARPSTGEGAESLAGLTENSNALVIERHGSFTFGKSLSEAFSILEILEKTARADYYARSSGIPFDRLTLEQIEELKKVDY